jgi:hypothetical protein
MTKLSPELSAGSGALILLVLLLIVTAAVFAVKFALDIALSKKLSQNPPPPQRQPEKIYAVKTSAKKRSSRMQRYTIIPEDKIFILENPSSGKDRYR